MKIVVVVVVVVENGVNCWGVTLGFVIVLVISIEKEVIGWNDCVAANVVA